MSHKRIVGDRLFSLDLHIWGSRNALSDCLFSGGAIRDVGAKNLLSLTSPGSLCCDFNSPTLCHCVPPGVPPANKSHNTTAAASLPRGCGARIGWLVGVERRGGVGERPPSDLGRQSCLSN